MTDERRAELAAAIKKLAARWSLPADVVNARPAPPGSPERRAWIERARQELANTVPAATPEEAT